jgi:hypothetical protein
MPGSTSRTQQETMSNMIAMSRYSDKSVRLKPSEKRRRYRKQKLKLPLQLLMAKGE